MQRGMVGSGLRVAQDSQGGARRVQMTGRRRKQPVLQFLKHILFALGLLDLRKAASTGVREQFGRQWAAGAQEEQRQFLQARLALRRNQTRPPVLAIEIFARKGQLFKVILQQQPRALRIRAG